MAENNNSMEMENTETESILLERHISSTPKVVENKISLENIFTLISDKFNQMNGTLNAKLDSFESELKKQNTLQNVKLNQVEEKFEEFENEMYKQNVEVNNKISKIETQYNNVKRQTEIVNEQVQTKISNLDDKVKQINETVQNQIEIQSREVENKYVEIVEQLEIKTKNEVNNQLELRTHILQNKLDQCESDVVDLTKNIQTIDSAISVSYTHLEEQKVDKTILNDI